MSTPVTLGIVDSNSIFREGLALLLERDRRFAVVGRWRALDFIRARTPRYRAEVTLVGHNAHVDDSEALVQAVADFSHTSRVVALVERDDRELRRKLRDAGVAGFVTKDVPLHVLIDEIAMSMTGLAPTGLDGGATAEFSLTLRETQVLRLIAQAKSNREIATLLEIAEGTVKRHTSNLFEKLDARSRVDAVRLATRTGIL